MSEISSSEIKIYPLSEKPKYAPVLAYWSYNEWYMNRDIPFEVNLLAYEKRAASANIPAAFVALCGTYPAGMASLKENDLWSRKDINPWLASVWVHPDFRKRGIGRMLISAAVEKAEGAGFKRLYLFLGQNDSFSLESYYTSLGWIYLEDCIDNDGCTSKIFYRETMK